MRQIQSPHQGLTHLRSDGMEWIERLLNLPSIGQLWHLWQLAIMSKRPFFQVDTISDFPRI